MEEVVSILLPIYKVENFIERCAESIFEQTYEKLDIIFVDDCSPDNSVKILKQVLERYPHRKNQVRIIKHEQNRGLAAARNTAVDAAIGKYLMHVDSDDFLDITTVKRCVDRIDETSADAVIFGTSYVLPDKVVTKIVKVPEEKNEYISQLLKRITRFNIWGAMYKTDLYKKYGIRAIEGINNGEDFSVIPRLLYNAKKIVGLDLPLYNYVYFVNENSYTNGFSINSARCHTKILPLLRDYFQQRNELELLRSLDYGETMIKYKLLLKWALRKNDKQYLQFVNDNYRTFPYKYSLSNRIILSLHDKPLLLKIYCRIGFWIKQKIKK